MNEVPSQEERKLLLLHGPAVAASREKLLQIKKRFDPSNVVVFEQASSPQQGSGQAGQVLASLQTMPMFGDKHLVILENPPDGFFGQLPTTRYQLPTTLLFWFDHEVDSKKYPGFQISFFPEIKEVSVFPFLDFLGQRDQKAFLELDTLKQAGYENQYFITMVFYLLRNLVVTPKGAKDFVKRKNERMKANFSRDELLNLYKDILEIDFKIKNGLLENSQAEFLIVNRFLNR